MSTATLSPESTADTKIHTLSVYVTNKPGVLSRIAQVFARRNFNIESLVVSPAANGEFSRMTIGVSGDPERLHCVEHTGADAVIREMALVKVRCDADERMSVLQVVEHFGCKTVDLTENSMVIMATGASDKVDAFIRMMQKYEVIELVRTGKVVMARGEVET